MRRIYTAADIPEQGEMPVPPGAIFTDAARELVAQRGVTVREVESGNLPGPAPEHILALGSDHGGFAMKEALKPLLGELGWHIRDVGVHEEKPADYPDLAHAVACLVAGGEAALGIVVDGAGIGSAMAANKVPGIRAALCYDKASARNSREHNHANVLTLGGRLLTLTQAEEVVRTWLSTPFGGGRHQARIDKIAELERRYSPWTPGKSSNS
jgi:ribose 5-phosphate isomerase B